MAKTKLRASNKGNKISLVLDVKEYEKLLDELDSIRAYDAAKKSGEAPIPFEQAMQQIERPGK